VKRFVADQQVKLKTFNFDIQSYAGMFEQYKPEVKQAQLEKDRQAKAAEKAAQALKD
jgi:hypothetical protein